MSRNFVISSLVLLSAIFFSPAWGESDAEHCKKAYETKKYVIAYPVCLKAAEQGIAPAQSILGILYFDGLGVKQDYAKAATFFSKQLNKVIQMHKDLSAEFIFSARG